MFVIGITGGTGAGKTTALDVICEMGGAVIDCDAVYHELLCSSRALLSELEQNFPGTVQDGVLNRKKLGGLVFGDAAKLNRLNSVTHAYIIEEVRRRLADAEREGVTLAAIDAIGLFESGLSRLCNATAAVTAPEALRVKRLTAREGISEEYAWLRIRAQKSDEWFRERCTVTLENSGDREEFAALCRQSFERLRGKDE